MIGGPRNWLERNWRELRWAFGWYTELTDSRIDMLNVITRRLIRRNANQITAPVRQIVPDEIMDRVSRAVKFQFGFSGWKGAKVIEAEFPEVVTDQTAGLNGQVMAAIMPSKQMAIYGGRVEVFKIGDREIERHPQFYYENVCLDTETCRRVIDYDHKELLQLIIDAEIRLAHQVVAGEAEYARRGLPESACCFRDFDADGNCDIHPEKRSYS